MDWDSEVERRLEALKCPACGGTNPYVCRCAKEAWTQKQKQEESAAMSPEEEQEWQHFQALVFPSKLEICRTCNTGKYSAYCACAKAKWRVWNRNLKTADAERPAKKTK